MKFVIMYPLPEEDWTGSEKQRSFHPMPSHMKMNQMNAVWGDTYLKED